MQSRDKTTFTNDIPYFFKITKMESSNATTGSKDNPVRYPFSQIVWVTQGCGYFTIDLEKFHLSDNMIYTIPFGRFHQFQPFGELSAYIISFNGDFLNLAIGAPDRPLFKEICADLNRVKMFGLQSNNRDMHDLLNDMSREFTSPLSLRLEILSSLFRTFLIYVKRQAVTSLQEEASSHKMRLYNNFYEKLDKEFKNLRQVAEYANELSVSPSYLTVVVKKVSGYSASYHIQQRMVMEAKRLALYSDASMKAVAYDLGFDDLAHFSKFFKNVAGISFSDFKKIKDQVA